MKQGLKYFVINSKYGSCLGEENDLYGLLKENPYYFGFLRVIWQYYKETIVNTTICAYWFNKSIKY